MSAGAHALAVACALALAACSGRPSSGPSASAPAAPLRPAPAGSARVTGTVRTAKAPPEPRHVEASVDPLCGRLHPDGLTLQPVVAGPGGELANALVRVVSDVDGYDWPVPREPVVLDQRACLYVPVLVAVRAGQPLRILNSDPTLHVVRGSGRASSRFSVSMPGGAAPLERTFREPELPVHLQCDAHPWMNADVAVLGHPFFAVTGADGAYAIAGLPAGTYAVEAWHPTLGTSRGTVTVTDGGAATLDLTLGGGS